MMEVKKITDPAFRKYGRVLGMEAPDLLARLAKTPAGEDVVYQASVPELEACAEFKTFQDEVYGGMPIQIGFCNGKNHVLNAVEFHRDSEINVALEDAILILGFEGDIEDDFTYDTSKMEAFVIPAGAVVEVFATSLHYAPCSVGDNCFRVVVILPKDTNTDAPERAGVLPMDKLLFARNKWLIAHEESGLGADGAFVGLKGENLTV